MLVSWEERGSRWDLNLGKYLENGYNKVGLYSYWDTDLISLELKK